MMHYFSSAPRSWNCFSSILASRTCTLLQTQRPAQQMWDETHIYTYRKLVKVTLISILPGNSNEICGKATNWVSVVACSLLFLRMPRSTFMCFHHAGLPRWHRGGTVPCWPDLATLLKTHLETKCFLCPGFAWLTTARSGLSLPDGVHWGGGVEGDPWVRNWMESVRYGKVTWLNLYTVTIPWHSKKCKMLSITFVILRYQINWLMRGSVSILATDVVLLVGFTQWGLRRKKQTQTNMSYTEISVTSDIEGVHHTNPDWGLRFCVSSAGNFMFWGCLSGKSPLHKVCDTLQQAGIGPQQLLVR